MFCNIFTIGRLLVPGLTYRRHRCRERLIPQTKTIVYKIETNTPFYVQSYAAFSNRKPGIS